MKIQKITATFLAVVLVTGAITLRTFLLVDNAFELGDKGDKKKHDSDYKRGHDKKTDTMMYMITNKKRQKIQET